MSFWYLQFPPKYEWKQVNLSFHSSNVDIVRSFFGGNFGLKKSFWLCLTFSHSRVNWSGSTNTVWDLATIGLSDPSKIGGFMGPPGTPDSGNHITGLDQALTILASKVIQVSIICYSIKNWCTYLLCLFILFWSKHSINNYDSLKRTCTANRNDRKDSKGITILGHSQTTFTKFCTL